MLLLFMALSFQNVKAQEQLLQIAREYLRNAEFDKGAATYKQLLEYNSKDKVIIGEYMQCLFGLNDYKNAEVFLKKQIKEQKEEKEYWLLLADVYKKLEDEKKMRHALDDYITGEGEDVNKVLLMGQKLESKNYFSTAVELYNKSKKINKEDPYLFSEELAIAYFKIGEKEKATESLLDLYTQKPQKAEVVKGTFLKLFEQKNAQNEIKKQVQKRISREPDNIALYDILAWMYVHEDDYENAFKQYQDLDKRMQEDGRRIMAFAQICQREKKYKAAIAAYNYVISKGSSSPYPTQANIEKINCQKLSLIDAATYTEKDVKEISTAYELFFSENEAYKISNQFIDYAAWIALYENDLPKAIGLLKELIQYPRAQNQLKARAKINMADYELLRGEIWESTLLYSQVDKDFKEDALGEEARYKNAKLAFYRGDFSYAQMQLDILKASTSELISNDAIDLSVLILENNPIKDSDDTPLRIFANADLLLFQHKYDEAINLLDSLDSQYPQHPLMDNILMERAEIAIKKRNYNEAGKYYSKIVEKYGDDVLADDALYRLAELNEEKFNNKDEAKRLFEKLIVDYPGSTYAERARKKFRILRGDAL